MKLKEVVREIREDGELGEMIKDMPFIGASTFTDEDENINAWELNFYNPEKENIVRIIINENREYEMLEGEFANKEDKEKIKNSQIREAEAIIEEEQALDIARKEYFDKYDMKVEKILIIYDSPSNSWIINLFSASSLKVIQIKIDAISGKVLESKEIEIGKLM